MGLDENYIQVIADRIRLHVPSEDLPENNSRLLFRIYAVLVLAKGVNVSESDVHDAWSAWMAGIDPEHDALLPFAELPRSVALADRPYVAAIRAVAGELSK